MNLGKQIIAIVFINDRNDAVTKQSFLPNFQACEAQRNSINWIFLWRLPIKNHLKPSYYWERGKKAKYLYWNSTRLMFVKKTRMPKPVKSLGYIKCHSSSSSRSLKALAILSDTTVRRSAVDWEDLKPSWKSEKRWHFSMWSTILLFISY